MNEVIQNMYKRRSCRKYTDQVVSDENIDLLLKAAMSAPSACNKQPWEFYVVKNEEILEMVRHSSKFTRINAPVAIVVCGNSERCISKKENDFFIQDCSSAITHILLAAESLGLGSLWCGAYPMNSVVTKLRLALDLDEAIIPLGIVYIGYAVEKSTSRTQYNENYVHTIE
jgi:nitroreductase